ncbi:MAG: helix-turn-helix domain-containing protein [Candidatus Zixiibacteriota bacterium]
MEKRRKYEFQGITNRTRELLSGDENFDVDFKEDLSGLKAVDLVSFANSENGGAILIGIRDARDSDGRQIGEIIGCTICDENKLSIISKAQSCSPALNVQLYVENLRSRPFYRIEIPSGKNKPYCTGGGKYKIRGDGRNLPLHPPKLLEMFLQIESKKFFDQFHRVTQELEKNITNTVGGILESVHDSKRRVDELGKIIRMEQEKRSELESFIQTLRKANNISSFNFQNEDKNAIDKRLDEIEGKLSFLIRKLDSTRKN